MQLSFESLVNFQTTRVFDCAGSIPAKDSLITFSLWPDYNFYTGKAFDFPRLFLVYRSQSFLYIARIKPY